LLLLVGGDSLHDLPQWVEPRRILELAGLLVVGRPDSSVPNSDELRARLNLPADAVRMEVIQAPLIDISSRDLRRRVAEVRSLRYLLPRAVECYIHDKRLYRTLGEPA
jgi:nicotinate-nucleotide adenylyltransferase